MMGKLSRRGWLSMLAVATVVALVVMRLSPNRQPAYSPDSISYLVAAHQLRAGNGLTLPDFSLFHPKNVPFTTWPPLYPIALASGVPPLLLQALLLGAVAALVAAIYLRTLRMRPLLAFGAALVTALTWPLLADATYVWSEVLCLVWVMVAVLVLSTLYERPANPWPAALGAAAAITLAIYTRYASLVDVPALGLLLLIAPIERERRWKLALGAMATIGGLVAPLLLRNLYLTGHLSGAVRAPSKEGILQLLPDALQHLEMAFAVTRPTQLLFVLGFAALLGVSVFVLGRRRHSTAITEPAAWVAIVALVFALFEFLGIVALRAWRAFDPLDTRLTSLVPPLLLVAMTAFAVQVWRHGSWSAAYRSLLLLPMLFLLVLSGITSSTMVERAGHEWRTVDSPKWPQWRGHAYTDFHREPFPSNDAVTILACHPLVWHFLTGLDFRRIPATPWSSELLDNVEKRATAVIVDGPKSLQLANALGKMKLPLHRASLGGRTLDYWR